MNEKALAALIMSNVLPKLRALPGMAAAIMARSYQPKQNGRITTPVLYFFFLDAHRYGWTGRKDVGDPLIVDQIVHTEMQQYEQPVQFMALVPQNPADTSQLSAADVLAEVSAIMQSDELLAAFRASDVGVQRITDVRNTPFVNDEGRFEFEPSFDVTLTHKRTRVTTQPAVVTLETQIRRV